MNCLSLTFLTHSPFSKQEDEKGFITTDGGGGGCVGGGGELGSPDSLPELERPPLRKIDQYVRPDCPCCNMSKRYTVAFLASIGTFFFLSFYIKHTRAIILLRATMDSIVDRWRLSAHSTPNESCPSHVQTDVTSPFTNTDLIDCK